jgi:hypothetical protein
MRLRQRGVDGFFKLLCTTLIKIKCYIYHNIELTRDMGVPMCQKGSSRNVIHLPLSLAFSWSSCGEKGKDKREGELSD